MQWQVFTFDNPVRLDRDDNKIPLTYAQWLNRLLNGIRAEQVIHLSAEQVLVHFPSPYIDEFDEFGIPE